MGFRTTMSMLAVLFFLVAAALVMEKPWREKNHVLGEAPILVAVNDASEITGITIQGPKGTVKLVRGGERWEILGEESRFPADEDSVEQLLEAVADLNRGTLVSREGTGRSEFAVGEDMGIGLTYNRGEETVGDLVVGGSGPDFFSGYVRPRDTGETLQVNVFLRPLLDREPGKWRDLGLMDFDPARVSRVEMAEPGRSVSLTREDGSWKVSLPEGSVVEAAEVDRLLARLSEFRAMRGAESIGDENRGEPSLRVTVTLDDGTVQGVSVGTATDEEQEEYFVSPLGRNEVFLIWDTTVKELTRFLDAVVAG